MTTARDVIAEAIEECFETTEATWQEIAANVERRLLSAPNSIRLELTALLYPEMIQALREMCELAEENSQYKGEYLATKHRDAEEIAKARRLLPAPAEGGQINVPRAIPA